MLGNRISSRKTTKEIADYVGREFKNHPGDIRLVVLHLQGLQFTLPTDPAPNATETERMIWRETIKSFCVRRNVLSENIRRLYSLVWGQCSDVMRQKIEALDEYAVFSVILDGVELLQAIKNFCFNFQSQKYVPHSLHKTKRQFYLCSQGKDATTQSYFEKFLNVVDVIQHSRGTIGHEPGIELLIAEESKVDIELMTPAQREVLKGQAQERYLVAAFLLGSDRTRYGRLIENLKNDYLQGQDNYPKTVIPTYNLLTHWKEKSCNLMFGGSANDGVSFANVDGNTDGGKETALVNSGGGQTHQRGGHFKGMSHITCYHCQKKGHYSSDCDGDRQERQEGATMLMDSVAGSANLTELNLSNFSSIMRLEQP